MVALLSTQAVSRSAMGEPPRIRLRQRLVTILLFGFYAMLLQYAYADRIAPAFEYLNLYYRRPETVNYVLALVLVGLLSLAMPSRMVRPSDLILWLMLVMVVTPSILVPQFIPALTPSRSLTAAVMIAACFSGVTYFARTGPGWSLRVRGINWWVVILCVTVATYAYMAVTAGLAIRFVSLGNVYGLRSEFSDQIAATGPALGYLVRIQGNVVNPLVLAYGLWHKRWSLIALPILGQLLIFSVTGYKIILLSVPALIVVTLVFRRWGMPSGRIVLVGLGAITAIALVVDGIVGGQFYTEVFVDRLLITPGTLTAAHMSVFSAFPKSQWHGTVLAYLIGGSPQPNPNYLVGSVFFGNSSVDANANLFADGYSNFGYAGMIIESMLLIPILWLIDAAGRHLPLKVSAAVLLIPTIALANSSVFATALTDGVAYAVALMAILPATGWRRT